MISMIMTHGDEDERDEGDILANPRPHSERAGFPRSGRQITALGTEAAFDLAVTQRVTVITRPLPSEGVPNCSIRIGTATATTNGSGNATINLSGLRNGEHDAVFRAPDTSDDEMGPDFPPGSDEEAGLALA